MAGRFFPRLRVRAGLLLACLYLAVAAPVMARAGGRPAAEPEIARLIKNGGCILTRDNTILFSRQADTLLVPASTWKIATSLLALETLGPGFRFETRFYEDGAGNLYV
ncbi:MAG: D-alanyl-D-alanine carboxypeptidase, partial [Desulfobacteraceae bacterium]|nr:D-alanyl-D-alanine carboxypeptidase [Desulfobacteraceae bacterium]